MKDNTQKMEKDERQGYRIKQRAILDDYRQKYPTLHNNDPLITTEDEIGIARNHRIQLDKPNVELNKMNAAL